MPTVVFFGLLIGIVLLGSQLLAIWWWPVRRFEVYTGGVGALFLVAGLLVGMRAREAWRSRLADDRSADALPGASLPPLPSAPLLEAPRRPVSLPREPLPPPIEPLTPRELEILASLASGCSNAEIADRHFVSLNTVKTHLRQIYGKLDATRRVQAVLRARRMGLIE